MNSQNSANQLIHQGKASLEEALKLVVDENKELHPDYLDNQLIKSMKSDWPKDKAVPLVFAEKKLYVGTPNGSNSDFAKELSELVNKVPIQLVPIKAESWKKWAGDEKPKPVFMPVTEKPEIKPAASKNQKAQEEPKAEIEEGATAQLGAELAKTLEIIPQISISATDENSIGQEVRRLISEAAESGASDIHFEPIEKYLIIRYRIDGVLKDICKYRCTAQADYRKIILARIKIIADLNIAESRIPQDGRVTETVNNKKIDLRVSTLPVLHGEKCVIRLLPHENTFLDLGSLGMPDEVIPVFESWLKMSQGMVLITGPTGSGKTSTLYTSLAKTLEITKNVVTVEDPVEFQLARVNQVQVNTKAGLTFAAGLRSILRQDPDIVMIGEIRDLETAEISIQAALTGHLVLSTLHTNDAPSTINRLVDMGVQRYLIATALVGVGAQRLVRKVCSKCKEEYTPSDSELEVLKIDPSKHQDLTFVRGRGCQTCNNTGYSGRDGLFEIMPVTSQIKQMIQDGAGTSEYRKALDAMGLDTLFSCGVKKIIQHRTTVEELLRVVPAEQD